MKKLFYFAFILLTFVFYRLPIFQQKLGENEFDTNVPKVHTVINDQVKLKYILNN